MIIGNGMIAKAFSKYPTNVDSILYASGVSNSQETDSSKFDREFNMVKCYVNDPRRFIYFSTTSIYDESLLNSPYLIHKKGLENYISKNFNRYTIFRLPIVVGHTDNQHSLIKNLYTKICNGENINVFSRAWRSILDVEDLVYVVNKVLEFNKFNNEILDLCLVESSHILHIIKCIEKCADKESNKIMMDRGQYYGCKYNKLKFFLEEINFQIDKDYVLKTIEKYYLTNN